MPDAPIAKQYPTHATVYGLMRATEDFFNGKNVYAAQTVKVFGIELIPFIGTKMLMVLSESMGSEPTSRRHAQVIRFMDVHYAEEMEKGYLQGLDAKTGEYFFLKPIESKVQRCDVWCDCGDFQWRMAFYVDQRFKALAQQLLGEVKHYKRKTPSPDKGGRPYVNPDHLPGMCKHLVQVMNSLRGENLLVGS